MNDKLLEAVKQTYADSWMEWPEGSKQRRLMWKADELVSRDEAIEMFKAAGVLSYNAFTPELLEKLPADVTIRIAREYSVCVYVYGQTLTQSTADEMLVDEFDRQGDGGYRLWWD